MAVVKEDIVLINLRDIYDVQLLNRFYQEIMMTFFPSEDERDALESWVECLDPAHQASFDSRGAVLHVIVAIHPNEPITALYTLEACLRAGNYRVTGGICFEFYAYAGVWLLSYIITKHEFRGLGLSKTLSQSAIKRMEADSVRYRGCLPLAIVAETYPLEHEAHHDGDESGISPEGRHKVLYSLGFRQIMCPYEQPPLEPGGTAIPLLLLVYRPELNPQTAACSAVCGLPSSVFRSYIESFCETVYGYGVTPRKDYTPLPFYTRMLHNTSQHRILRVKPDLPWVTVLHSEPAQCTQPDMLQEVGPQDVHADVVIVGAGAAGLSAAARLASVAPEKRVIVVEASGYLGGRLKQVHGLVDWPLDLGAEYVHGAHSVLADMIRAKGWTMEFAFQNGPEGALADPYQGLYLYMDGKVQPLGQSHALTDEADALWDKMLETDFSTHPDMSVLDFMKAHGASEGAIAVITALFAQTHAADMSDYGAREAAWEQNHWEHGGQNYRLVGSFQKLVDEWTSTARQAGTNFMLNWPLRDVNYSNEGYVELTSYGGEALRAKQVLLTVPATSYLHDCIGFEPGLPHAKTDLVAKMNMDGGAKVIAVFSRKFWTEEKLVLSPLDGLFGQIWFHDEGLRPEGSGQGSGTVTAVGLIGASRARQARGMTSPQLVDTLLKQLDNFFPAEQPSQLYTGNQFYFNWLDHPYIRGAYTSPSVHAFGSRAALFQSVEERLFFAGEGTTPNTYSCIFNAMESAFNAVDEMCSASSR